MNFSPKRLTLPYYKNSAYLFNKLVDLPWSIYIDSCFVESQFGRYDILTADPYVKFINTDQCTLIETRKDKFFSDSDPFYLIQEYLGTPISFWDDLPFQGGAMGYWGYDLKSQLEYLPHRSPSVLGLPNMAIGLYDWSIIVDHDKQLTSLISLGLDSKTEIYWKWLSQLEASEGNYQKPTLLTPFQSNIQYQEYETTFNQIMHHIAVGDCYQVNLTQRFSARCQGNAWNTYQCLRQNNPAPYACYFNLLSATVLSFSPELFLSLDSKKNVITKPIKGTIARGRTIEEDYSLQASLKASEKDKAENLMIVDLLRNDLSRVCEPGTIKTRDLFSLESYPAVHHMVSTIEASLAANKTAIDLLRYCFPGGSITGAPKIRAMELIGKLEPERRGVYCGSLGYVSFDGSMKTNICIRTLVWLDSFLHCWAGGGIVADSKVEAEYKEALLKLNKIFSAFKGC